MPYTPVRERQVDTTTQPLTRPTTRTGGYIPVKDRRTQPTPTEPIAAKPTEPRTLAFPERGEFTFVRNERGERQPVTTDRPPTSVLRSLVQDGKSFVKNGIVTREVNHIIPKALGGTDTKGNLEILENRRSIIDKILRKPASLRNRQEGRVLVEIDNIDKFQRGEITQEQAILNILAWDTQHNQKSIPRLFAEEFPNTFKNLKDFATNLFSPKPAQAKPKLDEPEDLLFTPLPEEEREEQRRVQAAEVQPTKRLLPSPPVQGPQTLPTGEVVGGQTLLPEEDRRAFERTIGPRPDNAQELQKDTKGVIDTIKGLWVAQRQRALASLGQWAMESLEREPSRFEKVITFGLADLPKELFKLTDWDNKEAEAYNMLSEYFLGEARKVREESGIEPFSIEQIGEKGVSMDVAKSFFVDTVLGGSSMLEAMAVTVLTKNPSLGAAYLAMMEASPEYSNARAAGKTPQEAQRVFAESATGTFILERIGLGFLFKRLSGSLARRMLLHGAVESLQEGAQTAWQNYIAQKGYDDSINVLDGVTESILVTLPIGLIGGGITETTQNRAIQQYRNQAIQMTQNMTGLDAQTSELIVDSVYQTVENTGTDMLQALDTEISKHQTSAFYEFKPKFFEHFVEDMAGQANMALTGDPNKSTDVGSQIKAINFQEFKTLQDFEDAVNNIIEKHPNAKEKEVLRAGLQNEVNQMLNRMTNADFLQSMEQFGEVERKALVDVAETQEAQKLKEIQKYIDIAKSPDVINIIDPVSQRLKEATEEAIKSQEGFARIPFVKDEQAAGEINLIDEARKYKSAEEFVGSQPIVYHGSPAALEKFEKGRGAFFTDDYADATGFAGTPDNVYEGYLDFAKPLVIDAQGKKWDELTTEYGRSTQEVVSNANKEGYDGVVFKNIIDNIFDDADFGLPGTIYYAFEPSESFKNESQLIDIWEKANEAGVAEVKEAEAIDRPAKPVETRKAIKEIAPKKAPLIRQRETTLLKNRIRNIARGIREGRIESREEVKRAQTQVIEILEKSRLAPQDRAKFLRTVKNVQTFRQLERILPEIEERIAALEQRADVRNLKGLIKKELKNTKTRTVNGKPVGRFTPELQKVFDMMRDALKLNQAQAEEHILENLKKYQDTIPPDEVAMENRILSMVAGLDNKKPEELQQLLTDIRDMKTSGRMTAELQKFNREAEIDRNRTMAIDVITGGQGLPPGIETVGVEDLKPETMRERAKKWLKTAGKTVVGWKDINDILSQKDESAPFQSRLNQFADILDEKNAEKRGVSNNLLKVRQLIYESYGLKSDREVVRKLRDDAKKETIGEFKNAFGDTVRIRMSRAEARKRWMEMQDPSLEETLTEGMGYTDEIRMAIDGFLTAQDKAFARAQLEFYQEYYKGVNEVYGDVYGVDLPFNEFYSPISREGIDRDASAGFGEFLQEMPIRRAVTSGSLKSRVRNIRTLKKQSDAAVLEQHIVEMEHFKAHVKKVRELRDVYGNATVRTAIVNEYNKGILAVIDSFLDDFTRGGVETASNIRWVDKLRGNYTRAVLGIKASIGVKQLVSFIAYADAIPVKDFSAGQIDFWTDPVGNAKTLLRDSTLLRTRGQNMERDIKVAMKSDQFANFRKNPSLINMLLLNVQMGDKGAIIAGGWSVYKYHRKKGLTHEQAIRKFESVTESTQQSSDLSELSFWQRGNTFAKLFTMFASSPNQYFRKELGAIRNIVRGRGPIKQHVKTIIIYHFLLPMFFQWVSDFGKWDEEEQKRAAILGSFNGIFIMGDGLKWIIGQALGMKTFEPQIAVYDIFNDIGKVARLISDDDITDEDLNKALHGLLGATGAVTGIPLEQELDIAEGLKLILEGEYAQGLGQFLGWSPYTMEKVLETKEAPAGLPKLPKIELGLPELPSLSL